MRQFQTFSPDVEATFSAFDMEYSSLIENKESIVPRHNSIDGVTSGNSNNEMRISIPKENSDMNRQIFLYALEKISNKHHAGKIALYRLPSCIDFDYYELFED
jgi:hypothetical protein